MKSVRVFIDTAASDHGSRPALLAVDGRHVTHEQMRRQLALTAGQLRELGIGPQDRVAIALPNGLEMALITLSIVAAATAAPLNPAYRREEYALFLGDLRPAAIVVLPGTQPELRALAAEMGVPILELVRHAPGEPLLNLAGETQLPPLPAELPGPDATALVLHTSGSTSRPKMVPLSQANLCASAHNIGATLCIDATDRCLNVMPLFHIHGLMAGLLAPVGRGGSVVCAPRFDANAFYAWLAEFRPSYYTAVPTMHQLILERGAGHGDLVAASQLRFIRSSSAPLPPQVMAELEATFRCPVIESYGMTEAAHQMASNPLPPGLRKPGTIGLAAGPEIAIMAEDGSRLLVPGEVGEIVIRGANVTAGYLGNPEANAKAFSAGWFRTGDQGYFDEDGYLILTGRLKEIINRGGEKIAPREVEERLLEHPAVRQAVVFAIPDARLGEEVGAAVILARGQDTTQRDLQYFVAATLADHKVPRKVLFLDEIPKGPTGKLQRIGLAQQFNLQNGLNPADLPPPPVEADPRFVEFVARQWALVLGLDEVTTHHSFLEAGGDSIQAMRLISRINELLNIELTMVDLFDAPTVAHQAYLVESRVLDALWAI